MLIICIAKCHNYSIKNTKKFIIKSPFYFRNYTNILKIKPSSRFNNLLKDEISNILKNNNEDNTTSVEINNTPIFPLQPTNIAFLLIG